jgi:glutathione S-transferase
VTIQLYQFSQSTCSQKARLCLAEKGIAYDRIEVNLKTREHLEDWSLQINPNGVVPSMVHDGAVILDSSVICEYLDEVFPEVPLAPRDAVGRAAMRAWMRFLEEVPTTAIRVPTFNKIFSKVDTSSENADFETWTDKMPLRKAFYRRMQQGGFAAKDVEDSLERLRMTLNRAERQLTSTPFLAGDEFSIADIVLIPTIVRMEDLGLDEEWAGLSAFTQWYERVKARPSFDTTYYPGTRLPPQPGWA